FLLEGIGEDDILESIKGDIDDFESELILSDMQTVENRLERLAGNKKRGTKTDPVELKLLEKLQQTLENESALRNLQIDSQETKMIRSFGLLSQKPLMVILNRSEDQDAELFNNAALTVLENANRKLVVVDARLDAEIATLEEEDRVMFLEEMGIDRPAADIVMQTGYALLGLISFFTVGDDEVRAWSIPSGTPAVEAAGTIHSDLQRGFIRAEVVSSEDLLREGSLSGCRDKGLLRLEGKTYVVQDGDVMHVRFAV
ncbi:DUF933 domain-containing protein, partial [bacterium]|nr:DUF933 domain-containing protein [bacterium]